MRRESSEQGSASAATAPSDPTRLANPNNPGAEGVFKNQAITQLCGRDTEGRGRGGWRGVGPASAHTAGHHGYQTEHPHSHQGRKPREEPEGGEATPNPHHVPLIF